jgi:hypothetical protein
MKSIGSKISSLSLSLASLGSKYSKPEPEPILKTTSLSLSLEPKLKY